MSSETGQLQGDQSPAGLALYYYPTCPYAAMVVRAIEDMGLDIELRNIFADPRWRQELIEGGGRRTVPCLRIEHEDTPIEWMYESYDIIDYLKEYY